MSMTAAMSETDGLPEGSGALHRFAQLAEEAPDHPFLVIDGEQLTRREFLERVAHFSGALARRGVGPRAHVVIVTPNCTDWCIAYWATVNLGAIPIPLDPQVGAWELERLFSVLDVKLCFAWSRFRSAEIVTNLLDLGARAAKLPQIVCLDREIPGTSTRAEFLRDAQPLAVPYRTVEPSESLMLASTSGTTGNPKIIVVPHRGFVKAQFDMAATLGLTALDRMLLGMPLFHQGGFGMGLQTLLAGGTAIYLSRFEPQSFLQTIERHHITVVQLSATLAKILLSHPAFDDFDLGSLRLAYFAGEVLPDAVAAEFWDKRKVRVVNVIGSSETATMVLWDSDRDRDRSASEYRPLPFTRIHVGGWGAPSAADQTGTLWVSTDALLLEYHANPDETSRRLVVQDGSLWFDTGDLVVCLEDGYVRFVGRSKRAMKRGPNLVHPEEVESFLLSHPEVAAVAVLREDHELYGDSIVAWVQPKSGVDLSRGQLLEFCRGKIAAYKIPDRFVVVEQLPVDVGKIQYKRMRKDQSEP